MGTRDFVARLRRPLRRRRLDDVRCGQTAAIILSAARPLYFPGLSQCPCAAAAAAHVMCSAARAARGQLKGTRNAAAVRHCTLHYSSCNHSIFSSSIKRDIIASHRIESCCCWTRMTRRRRKTFEAFNCLLLNIKDTIAAI